MQITLNKDFSYRSVMIRYTLLTVLSAIGCSLLGYLLLPFAAAFYAAVLVYEKSERRVVSYVLPVVIFVINFLLRGIYSLEAVAYLAVGLIIFFCVKNNKSKGETSFWISFAILVLAALSFILLLLELSADAGYTSARSFFAEYYGKFKTEFLERVSLLISERGDGEYVFLYNHYEAQMFFREIVIYTIPLTILASFVISGITLKLFVRTVEKNSDENSEIYSWNFGTSNIVSYFYIMLAVVALIANSDGSIFSFVIFTLNTLFTAIFAYIGIKTLYYAILSRKDSRVFAIILIVIMFVLLSSYAFQLASYFGVIVNILMNKALRKQK